MPGYSWSRKHGKVRKSWQLILTAFGRILTEGKDTVSRILTGLTCYVWRKRVIAELSMMRQEKCWRERRKLNQNLTCFPWGGVNGETQTLAGRVSCRQKWIWTTFLLMDGLPNLITFLLLHSENRGYQWKQKIMSGFWEWGEWYQFYERDREESVREKGHSSFLKMF